MFTGNNGSVGKGWRTIQSGEPTKILQFAKVHKLNSDECFTDVFGTSAQFPPRWGKMKKEGFCYRGKNSEVWIFMYSKLLYLF